MWFVCCVVRRYIAIDIFIIIITFPSSTCISSFFGSNIPSLVTFLFILKMFFSFFKFGGLAICEQTAKFKSANLYSRVISRHHRVILWVEFHAPRSPKRRNVKCPARDNQRSTLSTSRKSLPPALPRSLLLSEEEVRRMNEEVKRNMEQETGRNLEERAWEVQRLHSRRESEDRKV